MLMSFCDLMRSSVFLLESSRIAPLGINCPGVVVCWNCLMRGWVKISSEWSGAMSQCKWQLWTWRLVVWDVEVVSV